MLEKYVMRKKKYLINKKVFKYLSFGILSEMTTKITQKNAKKFVCDNCD